MGLLKRIKEFREYNQQAQTLEELILQAGIGVDSITKTQALNIPSVSACVEIISNTIAMLPIYLYKEENNKVEFVKDNRLKLLNDDTKDTLDSFQFKKALVEDYLLEGAGYSYINKERNNIKSLHYVDNTSVSINKNTDPIFKSYEVLVNGKTYRDFEFLKVIRKTKDGATGKGIIKENNDALTVAYLTLKYEKILMKTGGNKKGFLRSQKSLSPEALTALKTAWNNMYKDNTENVIILNDGVEFQEASATAVEMQMNENKKTNSSEVCKIFTVTQSILEGKATEEEYNNFIKICILPILKAIETALNKDLLLESEKGSFYFAFDTKELMKGDIEKRYKAYSEAVKAGWLSKNEIRYIEDFERIEGLDVVTMSLGDVIFDVNTQKYFTPNMDSMNSINKTNPGEEVNEENESRN